MHLTNFAINRTSSSFDPIESKRSLLWFFDWLRATNTGDPDKLWADMVDVALKTMIPAVPMMRCHYR